ncbi:MAG: hypothetical protein J5864_08870 [Oscillospiraceae bacterium]|nr:hypothetical protein [Oscillospiraceae bacterium]
MKNSEEFEFNGEIKFRPMILADLVEIDRSIRRAYQINQTLLGKDAKCIEYVIGLACDHLVELCEEMGVSAVEVDFDKYICCQYRAKKDNNNHEWQ